MEGPAQKRRCHREKSGDLLQGPGIIDLTSGDELEDVDESAGAPYEKIAANLF